MRFQITQNAYAKKPYYRWRLLAEDGRILAHSRKYKTLEACQNDVHYVALSAVSISLDRLLAPDSFALPNFLTPREEIKI